MLSANSSFSFGPRVGFYAGQRIVRLWEQVLHVECAFFCAIYGSYATSALFSGRFDGSIEPHELLHVIRFETLVQQTDAKSDINAHTLLIDLPSEAILYKDVGRVGTEFISTI